MGRLGTSLDGAKLGSPSAGLPSPRGYSYHMQYCTFISQPARYVAYERGKDLSTSLPLMTWSSVLHSWHTDRCVEGCLFEAHLSCAFGAALLQGPTQIISNTVFSFLYQFITAHTSVRKIPRLRLWRDSSSRGCSVDVSYRNVLLYTPIKKIPPELVLQRDLTNNSLSTVHSSPFRRFFWRYRAIPDGCFPERGR